MTEHTDNGATFGETETHPCDCANWRLEMDRDEQVAAFKQHASRTVKAMLDTADYDETGHRYAEPICAGHTTKRFAPGHDARLAGLLQAGYRAGLTVTYGPQGSATTSGDAAAMIRHLSDAMQAKITAEPLAPVKRERKVKVTHSKGTTTTAKVGRWEYEGWLEEGDEFCYRNKAGDVQRTFTYTIVS